MVISDYELLGKVISSGYREKTILYLYDKGMDIPTNIAKGIKIKPNHISKVLTELKEYGLVECMNEQARKGRIYRLTDKGAVLTEKLTKYG